MADLSPAVIKASDRARDAYLKSIDPNAFRPVVTPPVASGGAGRSAPPLPSARPPRLLMPNYYTEQFFSAVGALLPREGALLKDNKSNDFGFWFNYFLTEARKAKDTGARETPKKDEYLGRIFSVLFDLEAILAVAGKKLVLRPGTAFPLATSIDFNRMLAVEPRDVPLGALSYLVDFGFETFDTVTASNAKLAETGDGSPNIIHQFGNVFALQSAMSAQPTERALPGNYLFFYRGDSREPKVVVAQGGAKCRADLASWRQSSNIDAPWHPWKAEGKASEKMWIRRGNADNDYYTVNSIAMDFHISCAYPMLRLGEINSGLRGHIADWTDDERAKLRASRKADYCMIRNRQTGQMELALTDKARVYICVFKDDTALSPTYTNNTYPEMGVRTVDLSQIIAYVEIERYHNNDRLRRAGPTGARSQSYYESPSDGSTMTIHVTDWGWMSAVGAKNTLALANPSVLENKLNGLKGQAFEINHSKLLSTTPVTFDVTSRQAAKNVWNKLTTDSSVKIHVGGATVRT